MEPEKASPRMKTKKTKMLMSFQNTFWNKNRQTKKFVLNLKCNQSNDCIFCIDPISIKGHAPSLVSFSALENKQVRRSFFFQCSLSNLLNLLLTKLVRSIKTQKENSANIQPS